MSPYENRLNAESFRRIGLIAILPEENEDHFAEVLNQKPVDLANSLLDTGIRHLYLYHNKFPVGHLVFVYFELDGQDQTKAVSCLRESSPWWRELETLLAPHERATVENSPWQPAEFMNVIADNTKHDRYTGSSIGLTAGLHLEKELWYRTLHQTNWPGVIDQMARSNFQNWTTFMLEFGEQLLLFTHVEYIGKDLDEDNAKMKEDPVSQRWWTHTEPCLYSLVESGENWLPFQCV